MYCLIMCELETHTPHKHTHTLALAGSKELWWMISKYIFSHKTHAYFLSSLFMKCVLILLPYEDKTICAPSEAALQRPVASAGPWVPANATPPPWLESRRKTLPLSTSTVQEADTPSGFGSSASVPYAGEPGFHFLCHLWIESYRSLQRGHKYLFFLKSL